MKIDQSTALVSQSSFPELVDAEVFTYLSSFANDKSTTVLDIGCGTGIATRQIFHKNIGSVFACDKDRDNIEMAKKEGPRNIHYFTAPNSTIPLVSNVADIVTLFDKFHCFFEDQKRMKEIKRVLKRNGVFFIVNKDEVGGFTIGFREKLEELLKRSFSDGKQYYNPRSVLEQNSFQKITTRHFQLKERFTLKDALHAVQAIVRWKTIPESRRAEVARLLENHIHENRIEGEIARLMNVEVITAVNN
jgi:ubiquinone/menaquinone biosynthesis C-methylase UbiE